MKRIALWALATATCALLFGLQTPASAQTKVSIVHAIAGASETPIWVAQEQGFFAKHGVDVQLVLHEGTGAARRLGDEIPFGLIGVPLAILAVGTQGSDLRILAPITSARAVQHLVARPEIKQPAELKGKRVGVSGLGGAFWILSIKALEHLGLAPERDGISIVNIATLPGAPPGGGLYGRLAWALESGAADAVILDVARSRQLQAKGYSLLLDMSTANIAGAQSALVVDAKYLREHADVVEKVVRGIVEGTAFALSPANRDVMLKLMMTHMGLKDLAAADGAYKSFVSTALRKPYPSIETLEDMRRVMALHEPKLLEVRLSGVIEDRFVRRLDETGELNMLYEAEGKR